MNRLLLMFAVGFAAAPALAQLDPALEPGPGIVPGTTPTAFADPLLVQRYQATITPEDLAAHLFVFASDYFEGRETTTRGQKLAAAYLAGQYRKLGLEPKGTMEPEHPFAPEAYFQPFTVYGSKLTGAGLTVRMNGETMAAGRFTPDEQTGDFYPYYGTLEQSSGGVVFAGYGIQSDAYDDYGALEAAGVDTEGRWLLMLGGEPTRGGRSLVSGEVEPSNWGTSAYMKANAALSSGPIAGVLLVDAEGGDAFAGRVAQAALRSKNVGRLSLTEQVAPAPTPPIFVISPELANTLLEPSGRTVAELRRTIERSGEPTVFAVGGAEVASTLQQGIEPMQTENVLAFIEGSDPALKHEVVVISSHYDHIGIDYGADGDNINNGADDDGSGNVTMLELAEAFMEAKRDGVGPRRSILFLNVSGEEKGLLGSKYYADAEPVFPIENTVANLNIDMVGRFDPTHPEGSENYVYIIGSNLISQELHDINQRVNAITGVELELDERFNSKDDPNRFYARSDHWNFGKHGVPFIFFFTGTHEDYHGVDDEPHKIAYDRMARIGRLIFATAWQLANQEEPPEVSGVGFN